jgi:Concanavalin A-like lectin/glucanases superfamily
MKTQNQTKRLCGRFLTTVALALTMVITARADYQSTVLNDHPLAFYPINSSVDPTGTTATDLSGNGNNGTYNGTDPEFNTVPGPSSSIPNALYFDGFTSYVDLSTGSNPALLNFGGPITMEAWVQPASPTVGSGPPADILAKGYDGTNEMTLRAQGGIYYGGTYNNNTGGGSASGGQQTTNWTYLVSTYDGTNWNIYVNSKLVGQGSDAIGAINFTAPWAIGDGTTSTGGGNSGDLRFFSGNLTEVALYTNALTPAQVLNHFCVGELGTTSSSSRPIIITQPQPQSAFVGGTATFSVTVASALPTTNQWYANNIAMPGKTNSTLTLTNVGAATAATNYSVVVGNSNGITNSASVNVTVLAAGNSLKWNSAGTTGVWDTNTTYDWINTANSVQTNFNANDQVLFDDTVGVSNNVIINGTVAPSVLTVNSSTNYFTLNQGTSPMIGGVGSIIKKGSSLLTIYSPQGFNGVVNIGGGTIYAGNNCFNLAASFTVTNNATLDIGGGSFNTSKPVTVSGTGVNGEGAIYNSYDDYPGAVFAITLVGDTTFGGVNRWDLNSGSTISGPHKVTLNWNDPADSSYAQWTGVTIGTEVGDIEVAAGKLGLLSMGTTFGNPAGNFLIDTGTEVDFYTGDPGYVKNFHVFTNGLIQFPSSFTTFSGNFTFENGARLTAYSGSGANRTFNGTATLNGVVHIVLGDVNYVFTNVFSGTGGFVFDAYNHEMFLQASNTYSGPTVIGGGLTLGLSGNGSISHSSLIWLGGATIDVSGRADNTLALTSGQTLGGIGTISGTLVVPVGATISPAGTNVTLGMVEGSNPTGTINASNSVTLNGTTTLKLNGSGINDQVQAGTSITYGGTLNLVNISGSPLANGNSFQIFNAPSYIAGSYTITPATPGAGLAWDTSQLNTFGTIGVTTAASQPVISSTKISGGNLIFSGTGGTANGNYWVLTATNLATPIGSWPTQATYNYDATGAFSVTNAINSGTPERFYRIKQ